MTEETQGVERLEKPGAERWVSSTWRVLLIALAVAALLAAFTTLQVVELEDARGREIAFSRVFGYRFAYWLFWVVALFPIVALFRFLRRRTGSLLLTFVVHLLLSWFVSGLALDWRSSMERQMVQLVMRGTGEEGELPRGGLGRAGMGGLGGGGAFQGPGPDGPGPEGGGPEGGTRPEGGRPEGGPLREGEPPRRRPGGPAPRDLRRAARRARNAEARAIWQRAQRGRELAYYWILLGLGMGVGAFLETRNQERRAIAAELRSEKLRTQLAQTQIGTLEAQVQPHFLFNALHAVGGLIRAGEDRDALKTLSSLGSLLRRTLEHGADQRVRLSEELEVVERYLDVERIRLAERLKLEIEVEPAAREALVPSLFLLPLVENAVKYAIAPRPDGGKLRIDARSSGDSLLLEVADDGPGYPPEVLSEPEAFQSEKDRKHIGLANCKQRIRALYGEKAQLDFLNAAEGGAVARLRLPLETTSPS